MKTCKRCNRTLSCSAFYIDKKMKGGYVSFCKECTNARKTKHRNENIEQVRAYDRNRPNKVERAKKRAKALKKHRLTKEGRLQAKAHWTVGNAIRAGRLIRPDKCACGRGFRIEGHHPDYSKPLEVEWLCAVCHKKTR